MRKIQLSKEIARIEAERDFLLQNMTNQIQKNKISYIAIRIIENKKTYLKRCSCGALLDFEYDDIRVEEMYKSCDDGWVCGYITCPNCLKQVYLGDMSKLTALAKNKY